MDERYRSRKDPVFKDPVFEDPQREYRHPQSERRDLPEYTRQYNQENPPTHPSRTESHYRPEAGHNNNDRDRYRDNRHDPHHSITYPVEFHGKTSEYFKIWIVNIFLTIITLYVYSAWAKVRTKRYFYGNTSINGSTFEYHATGKQLVIGRLIAAALLITYTVSQGISATLTAVAFATIVVMFPWAIWRSLKFNARASSFRNIRFGFDGKATVPYINFLVIPLIIFVLIGAFSYLLYRHFGPINIEDPSSIPPELIAIAGSGTVIAFFIIVSLLIPLIHRNLISYSHNNHRYGSAKFSAGIKTGRIFGIHFVTLLLSTIAVAVVGGIIFGAFKLLSVVPGIAENLDFLEPVQPYMETIISIAVYLILIPATGFAIAYFKSSIRNHRYNATTINSRVQLNSATGTWSLWWLTFSNLMMIILTIGFAYPYTKIRSARYFARHTSITVAGGLESFTENERTKLSAMGEEMADAFDVEFDIGI